MGLLHLRHRMEYHHFPTRSYTQVESRDLEITHGHFAHFSCLNIRCIFGHSVKYDICHGSKYLEFASIVTYAYIDFILSATYAKGLDILLLFQLWHLHIYTLCKSWRISLISHQFRDDKVACLSSIDIQASLLKTCPAHSWDPISINCHYPHIK